MAKLSADDLLTPKGDLQESVLFPDVKPDDVRVQLGSWIDDAYDAMTEAEIDVDDADVAPKAARVARKWAYYKAYEQVFIRLAAQPMQFATDNEASQQYDPSQLKQFGQLKDQYLAEYDNLFAGLTAVIEITPEQPTSVSLKNQFSW